MTNLEFDDDASEEYLDSLLAKAIAGDPASLDELFARERAILRKRANLIASQSISISVIVQEAIATAAEKLDTLKIRTIAGFRVWLATIFRNKVNKTYRKKMSGPRFLGDAGPELENLIDDSMTAEEQYERQKLEADLNRRIDSLDSYQRQVLMMRFNQGKSIKEIAEALGKSEVAISSARDRAIDKLRYLFREEINDEQ